MLANDIRKYIIKPALWVTDLWSESAEILVHATGLVETNYMYLMQMGTPDNGGLGFFQQEPSDYKDICKWLRSAPAGRLQDKILAACYYSSMPTDAQVLASNIKFAALMCRVHYQRIQEPLPVSTDAAAMCNYYIKYYNGGGKATFEKCIHVFQELCVNE